MKKAGLILLLGVALIFLLRSAYYAFVFDPPKNVDACGELWFGVARDTIEKRQKIFADDGVLFIDDYCGIGTRIYLVFEGFPFKRRLTKYWIQFGPRATKATMKRHIAHYGLDSSKIDSLPGHAVLENERMKFTQTNFGESYLSFKIEDKNPKE